MRDKSGNSLWVELLGEVRAWQGESEIVLGPPKQRALFAVLALRHGHTVTTDEIVDALWGEAAPATAEGSMHTYVHGLRTAMESAGANDLLVRTRAGYVLQAAPDEVDVAVVESGIADARRHVAQGSLERAASRLRDCLPYWRDVPLAGLAGPLAEQERSRLALLRLDVIEEHARLMLESGDHWEIIAELEAAVRDQPLRENLRGHLMLALYRSGRQAEALAVFDAGRRALADDLGIDPGAELIALHARIMRSDPDLAMSPSRQQAPDSPTIVPAQLPHTVPDFVGRADELATLEQWRDSPAAGMRTLLVSAIDGAGGIGKTALAISFGHQVMADYPDGQLYVDLRGFDPCQPPLSPSAALSLLLRGLGVTAQPGTVEEQAALYRSLLANKRMLVVLDNAVSADQVGDLLPETSGSLVLITSRNRLGGLLARDSAHRLTLGLLSPDEAFDLLRQVVGPSRVEASPESTAELARLCGYLPLALRIAGELVSSRPDAGIEELLAELADTQNRLDTLAVEEDEMASVRGVFSWSYQCLKPALAAAFRRLGLHPGPDIGEVAAAALIGVPVDEASELLQALREQHLLECSGDDRYRFHDLLREYSAELAEHEDPIEVRHQALQALMVWYLHSAVAAEHRRQPGAAETPQVPSRGDTPAMSFDTEEDAAEWQTLEAPNILSLNELAAKLDFHDLAWQLSWPMYAYYYATGLLTEWIRLLTTGLSAAERLGSRDAQVRLLNQLSIANSRIGNNAEAVQCLERALTLVRETGEDRKIATLLANLASTLREMGHYEEGLPHALEAVALARRAKARYCEVGALDAACELYVELKRPELALEYGQAGLELARPAEARLLEANLLVNVAHAHRDLGQFDQAIGEYGNALTVCEAIGDRYHQGLALLGLAELHHRSSREDAAEEAAQQALEIFVKIDAEEVDVAREFLASRVGRGA